MKRKILWMGIAGLVLVIGSTAVQARGHRGRQHHFAGPRFEQLDLTQIQKDQMKSLRSENQKQMIQLRADMQLAHVELGELMHEKNPNQKQVGKAVAKVNSARGKMTASRVHQKLAVNKILTDEQLQKLEEMPRGRRGGGRHFQGRSGPGMRGPQGRGMGGWSGPPPVDGDSRS